jgi:hypothetical protein
MTFCVAHSRGPDFWCTVPKFVAPVCYESNCVANEKCVAKPPRSDPYPCLLRRTSSHRIGWTGFSPTKIRIALRCAFSLLRCDTRYPDTSARPISTRTLDGRTIEDEILAVRKS